ncbi:Carboxypeptidase [Nesidiocoris tenuis]|uniref:Carboxypeptidase n=1 Tax=Nesidiocoris tenuis TaxID=355587 RepID=A0ABN7B6M8_9HEMI|nr:Carboxypeptidase [Nesidiocoris tenuis]
MKIAVLMVLFLVQLSTQASNYKPKRDTLFGYPIGQPYYPRPHDVHYPSHAAEKAYNAHPDVYVPTSPGYEPDADRYAYAPGYQNYHQAGQPSAAGIPVFFPSSSGPDVPPPFPARAKPRYPSPNNIINFRAYSTVEQIDAYLDYISDQYPDITDVKTIGYSGEGRPIRMVRIHPRTVRRNSNKPKILVDAGIHAREWIAPAVALYMIQQLVENNDDHRNITEQLEWHIIPLLNPDGYAYSMTTDRMWRKNRSNTTNPYCSGVDLNRNFDLFFGGLGTSSDPCDETYTGKVPFSEPEARALRDYATSLSNVRLYLTLHSFGQFFLYPWGFGDVLPRDWRDLDKLGRVAQKALERVRGTKYRVGSSTNLLGAAAGGSDDWMKGRAGIKYSYTVELPGGGEKGFDLPASQILAVSQETWEALKTMGYFILEERRRHRKRRNPQAGKRLDDI